MKKKLRKMRNEQKVINRTLDTMIDSIQEANRNIELLHLAMKALTAIAENVADMAESNRNAVEEQDERLNALERMETEGSCTAAPSISDEESSLSSMEGA
jgi:methyl-accepting chemotaxis protein